MEERYQLAIERISEITEEMRAKQEGSALASFFIAMADFCQMIGQEYVFVKSGDLEQADLETLKKHNKALYEDILPEHYGNSYANPDFACNKLGGKIGRLCSFLYTELRGMIPGIYEQDLETVTIRLELLLEVYSAYLAEQENDAFSKEMKHILYWFISDYYDVEGTKRIADQIDPYQNFAVQIVEKNDLKDPRYLYYYGEYVTEQEIACAAHLSTLSEERLQMLADTFTEGYRIGFEVTNKDIHKKKTVNIRYAIGFEQIIIRAIRNFAKLGLEPTIYRAGSNIFQGNSIAKNGFFGANPNKQYDFDHKEDLALFLDKQLVNRRLEVTRTAYQEREKLAAVFGGPAVMEIFGETPFAPENKETAPRYSADQQKLSIEYASEAGAIVNQFIPGEERSFTIIALPIPAIGEQFAEIFDAIVTINTLDYKKYQKIQQTIIDTLNQADYCEIHGTNGNRTDLRVNLYKLNDPEKETIFENCVADVNIPVGEVFTSPILEHTEGILHVSRVFLNELEYRDLELTFENGKVSDYHCSNFETEEENRKYIKDNILFHHDTLPMGEFAIGTNTTAYVAAGKYGIEDKLPILIAEKMGPHFAVGDTCYSHAEDVAVFNPDGKEIVARDNEVSILRKTDRAKAYFNCHTDITIPYDELGELAAVKRDGTRSVIIQNGRFVLSGCEALNEPFNQ
ncbi:MAG: aminopeptidase [Lachnospiraceae bacterium]|nr:aminopeptidase [Lachnospiraceae bacterium]